MPQIIGLVLAIVALVYAWFGALWLSFNLLVLFDRLFGAAVFLSPIVAWAVWGGTVFGGLRLLIVEADSLRLKTGWRVLAWGGLAGFVIVMMLGVPIEDLFSVDQGASGQEVRYDGPVRQVPTGPAVLIPATTPPLASTVFAAGAWSPGARSVFQGRSIALVPNDESQSEDEIFERFVVSSQRDPGTGVTTVRLTQIGGSEHPETVEYRANDRCVLEFDGARGQWCLPVDSSEYRPIDGGRGAYRAGAQSGSTSLSLSPELGVVGWTFIDEGAPHRQYVATLLASTHASHRIGDQNLDVFTCDWDAVLETQAHSADRSAAHDRFRALGLSAGDSLRRTFWRSEDCSDSVAVERFEAAGLGAVEIATDGEQSVVDLWSPDGGAISLPWVVALPVRALKVWAPPFADIAFVAIVFESRSRARVAVLGVQDGAAKTLLDESYSLQDFSPTSSTFRVYLIQSGGQCVVQIRRRWETEYQNADVQIGQVAEFVWSGAGWARVGGRGTLPNAATATAIRFEAATATRLTPPVESEVPIDAVPASDVQGPDSGPSRALPPSPATLENGASDQAPSRRRNRRR